MEHTILIVEDDEDDRLFEGLAFEDIGLGPQIRFVTDGHFAIEYLKHAGPGKSARYPAPAIVLLDLKLPKVPGIKVLRWIRSHPLLNSLVVVPLTSSNSPKDIANARKAGANDYLIKPLGIGGWRAVAWKIQSTWLHPAPNRQPSWGTLTQTAAALA